VRQLERPEDSRFTGPDPPPVPCRHVREQDWLDRRAFELDWWDGSGTNNRRKALKHVCRWQDEAIWQSLEGRIPPATRRKRPTPTRDVVARLTGPREDATYRDQVFRHVAHFLAHTGRRISEARDLKVSDVDWDALDIYLWAEKHDEHRPMRYEPMRLGSGRRSRSRALAGDRGTRSPSR
jgi:integrase